MNPLYLSETLRKEYEEKIEKVAAKYKKDVEFYQGEKSLGARKKGVEEKYASALASLDKTLEGVVTKFNLALATFDEQISKADSSRVVSRSFMPSDMRTVQDVENFNKTVKEIEAEYQKAQKEALETLEKALEFDFNATNEKFKKLRENLKKEHLVAEDECSRKIKEAKQKAEQEQKLIYEEYAKKQ